MGKGGEQQTKIEIPKELRQAAVKNLGQADYVSKLPLMQNFGGAVAAFTPQQMAGMQGMDQAAASMGLPTAGFGAPNTGMNIPGMPAPQNFGGIQAHSTQGVYEDAMSRVPPEIREMYSSLLNQPGAKPPEAAPTVPTRAALRRPYEPFVHDDDSETSRYRQYQNWKRRHGLSNKSRSN